MKIQDTSGQDVVLESKKNHRSLYIIGTAALIAVAAWMLTPALSRWASADVSVPRDRLRTAVVQQGDLTRDVSVQGRVVAAVAPRLYSPAQGTITFEVDAGQQVAMGDVIATIESPELQNLLQQEEATLHRLVIELDRQRIQAKKTELENQKTIDMAQVDLTAADREKRRADQAYQRNAISQIDFEKAQDELANAKLIHQHAVQDAKLSKESLAFELQTREWQMSRQELLVTEIRRQVDDLTVRSPVNGIVGNLEVRQKHQLSKNQPIASVVDLSVFEVEVAIPESYADDLSIGMDAEIQLDGQRRRAHLVTVSPEVVDNQVVGRVRFEDDSPRGLRQNQRLTTRIFLEHISDTQLVRSGRFLEAGNGKIAYVLKDGVAERRAISVGARSLASVQILDGLEVGDEIVISSIEQFEGAKSVLITN